MLSDVICFVDMCQHRKPKPKSYQEPIYLILLIEEINCKTSRFDWFWLAAGFTCLSFLLKRPFKNVSRKRICHVIFTPLMWIVEDGRFPLSFLFEQIKYVYIKFVISKTLKYVPTWNLFTCYNEKAAYLLALGCIF